MRPGQDGGDIISNLTVLVRPRLPGVVGRQYEDQTHPIQDKKGGSDVPFKQWVVLADVVRIPFKAFENKAEIVDLSIGVPYFFFLRFRIFSIC